MKTGSKQHRLNGTAQVVVKTWAELTGKSESWIASYLIVNAIQTFDDRIHGHHALAELEAMQAVNEARRKSAKKMSTAQMKLDEVRVKLHGRKEAV
jgi:hypothetical protein